MKICDRCFNESGEMVQSTDMITFQRSDTRYDLCMSCIGIIENIINSPIEKKRPGRKKKSVEDDKDEN